MGRKETETEVVRGGNTGPPNKPQKTWDVTVNNYTETDIEFFKKLECNKKVISKEISESGTPHLQGRMTFKRTYRLTALKKLHPKAHWEETIKDEDSNYCMKIDSEVIINENNSRQGERVDLKLIRDEIIAGKKVDDIIMENPILGHQYGRTLDRLDDINSRNRSRTAMTTCEWIYGPTGSGKSHKAFEGYDEETHFLWTDDNGWWDGYNGQEIVIMNDYRGTIPYNVLLQLIDKWPMKVRRRNREPMPFVSKHIIITSSLPPDKIYKHRDAEDSLEQLLRRVRITELNVSLPPSSSGGHLQ